MPSKQVVESIILSRPGRIMIERVNAQGVVSHRLYAPDSCTERLAAQGWIVYVPARGKGWKRV